MNKKTKNLSYDRITACILFCALLFVSNTAFAGKSPIFKCATCTAPTGGVYVNKKEKPICPDCYNKAKTRLIGEHGGSGLR